MPDISKCANEDCPLKNRCYRFTCKPSEYQGYSDFNPKKDKKTGKVKCGYFIKN